MRATRWRLRTCSSLALPWLCRAVSRLCDYNGYGTIEIEPLSPGVSQTAESETAFNQWVAAKFACQTKLASRKTLGIAFSREPHRTTKKRTQYYSTQKRLHHEPVDQSGELLVVARGRRDSGRTAVHRVRVVLEEARHAQRRVPPTRIAHADD